MRLIRWQKESCRYCPDIDIDTLSLKERILQQAWADTRSVYERQALAWHEQRPRSLYEKPWLERFTHGLPDGARLLDLGCGSGYPIAGYFLERGFDVVGLDYSRPMLQLASELYPRVAWLHGDMRRLDFESEFDGIYSWDGFFHLTMDEQRGALPRFAEGLKPGGRLMLTVGNKAGEVTGVVNGETVYHASLSADEYLRRCEDCGLEDVEVVVNDPTVEERSILLARKAR